MTPESTGLLHQVVARAGQDAAFRQALVADPKGTLEREFGLDMPGHITLHVVEDTPTTRYLVLPPRAAQAGTDLSDSELEAVAGGWTADSGCNTCENTCQRANGYECNAGRLG